MPERAHTLERETYFMAKVFVIDQDKKPLAPCSYRRAMALLEAQKASVYRVFPFTIRLYRVLEPETIPLRPNLFGYGHSTLATE